MFPWDYDNAFLLTLCSNCHKNAHVAHPKEIYADLLDNPVASYKHSIELERIRNRIRTENTIAKKLALAEIRAKFKK